MLNKNGKLIFITPQLWRKPDNKLYSLIQSKYSINYIYILNREKSKDVFNVGTRSDLYIIENSKTHKTTEIIDEYKKVHKLNLSRWPFIPNGSYNHIKKLLCNPDAHKCLKVIYNAGLYDSRKLKEKKDKEYKWPIIHKQNKHGNGILWSNKKDKKHFTPKVVLNFNVKLYPYLDWKGEYGMSQISFGIPINSKKEGENIIKSLESPIFKKIILDTKWTTFQTDWRMFNYFNKEYFTKNKLQKKSHNKHNKRSKRKDL